MLERNEVDQERVHSPPALRSPRAIVHLYLHPHEIVEATEEGLEVFVGGGPR